MENLIERAKIITSKIDINKAKEQIAKIELQITDPDFWLDQENARSKMKELARLQKEVEDTALLQKYISEKNEKELEKLLGEMEIFMYLAGPFDNKNAILSIHAGQGGADAMDWASILMRMYIRFFEKRGWQYNVLDESVGEEAGIKSVSIEVAGEYAYGYLKGEQGVHRLVRLSPFNSDSLRHTSFSLVEVLPQMETVKGLDLKDDDLEWNFYRASSHGGQNVQKVSSAVRLKHIPTGIVVTSQTERYQAKNRESALKLLKAKLWVLEEEKKQEKEKNIKGVYSSPSWGNQIRNYVLHPYKMVKDTRTGVESGNAQAVLDGDIDEFIEAELKSSDV